MNLIEEKQYFLLKKTKKYLNEVKKKGIDVSKSSFCFLNTYAKTPGFGKIILWLQEKNNLKNILIIMLQHIAAISTFSNYSLLNNLNQKFDTLILTWGRKSNFKNRLFKDSFTNISSNNLSNGVFFVIYLDKEIPKFVPKNVILLFKKKTKKSLIYLLKVFFKTLLDNNLSIKKFFHYFSSQTVMAEIVNLKILSIINQNKIKKIIMPYEGQPFQNYVFRNLKKIDHKIRTIGVVHSMVPALPLNFVKRDGAPDYIYLSGNSQKNLFIKFLGWKEKNIKIIDSLRNKKKINKKMMKSFYFGMNINSKNIISNSFSNYLIKKKEKKIPILNIKKHPQMLESTDQLNLEKEINFLFKQNKNRFSKKTKKNISFFAGSTSAFIQFLENKIDLVHFTSMPILDVYTKFIWKKISPFQINEYTFVYNLLQKRELIRLSDKNYNLLKANIL